MKSRVQQGETDQANHLHATLLKFILQLGEGAELGRANGSEVGRVGEKDGPAISDELMEVNLALGSQCLEVGGYQGWSVVQDHISPIQYLPVDPRRRRGCS